MNTAISAGAILYLDTSALLKLYVQEKGTSVMLLLAASEQHQIAVSSLGEVELRAVVRARQRAGGIGMERAEQILMHLKGKLERPWLRVPLRETSAALACPLVDRHNLRAPDALQLASCLMLRRDQPEGELRFVCSDRRLLAAARAEGIPCWDPAAGVE